MYTLSQLRRGMRRGAANPRFFGRELNRLYHRRLYRWDYNLPGVDVVAEDWDVLLILDACRYDMFERHHDLPGKLTRRQSRGSHTTEFLGANFGGRDLLDTVYVTASPQLHRHRDRIDARFHDVVNVWLADGWDDEHGTVLPDTMAEYVRRAMDRYPRKRVVAHFVQPHYPFLGTGATLNTGRLHEGAGTDVWGRLMRGELAASPRTVREAIRDNLNAALPAVADLLSDLPGRVVVTSDHGNMLGERARPIPIREWGHPPGIYTEQLVTVPWLVHDSGDRRDAVAERRDDRDASIDDAVVADRLEALGYAE